jgi:plastocyanin
MKSPICSALLVLASLLPGGAGAAVLQLTVQGADGKPAADTVVLWRRAGGFQPFSRSDAVVIAQRDIRFFPAVVVVPVQGTVRFVNKDRFDHHVKSMPSGPLGSVPPHTTFEFRLARASGGQEPSADLKFETTGPLAVGCHLHGSMRAHIYVSPTPWAAVSDDKGRVTLDVPDGPGELVLWHPDQLTDQAPRALQAVGASDVTQALNFTPRRRPPPRTPAKGEYEY